MAFLNVLKCRLVVQDFISALNFRLVLKNYRASQNW